MLWGVYDEMGLIVIYNYFVFFNNCGDKKSTYISTYYKSSMNNKYPYCKIMILEKSLIMVFRIKEEVV